MDESVLVGISLDGTVRKIQVFRDVNALSIDG